MKVTFSREKSGFFDEMRKKVDEYFSTNCIKKTGNYKIYVKSAIFFLSAVFSYFVILFSAAPPLVLLFFCVVLGASFAAIGFNVMHDGAHGSYSSKKWLNELVAYSLNLMGGNAFIWKAKHNLNHHSYTNIEGMDDDIDIEPWVRTHHDQPRRWYHRYQHIYALALYGITYVNWIFLGDFKKYFTGKIGDTDLQKMNLKEHLVFWVSKISYVFLFIVLPIIKLGFWEVVIGYTVMSFVCGFILGIVFQLAHLMEGAEFPMPAEDSNQMETNWVRHQIATTVNFATTSRMVFWFTGGLNFQIVHHIFPKISHVHYRKINVLIRETCGKFGIKYTEYPSMWSAICSHVSYLKRMGAPTPCIAQSLPSSVDP